jgi:ATP-dependent exoDNAse (exonuclease V) beta subunit
MKSLRDVREAAERKRLFYVACTRAREELHLFAAPERSTRGEILRESSSLLKAAWPAAERHFVADTAVEEAAQVIPFVPAPPAVDDEMHRLDIAASVEPSPPHPPTIERLPLSFDPTARFRQQRVPVPEQSEDAAESTSFVRPEGSFAARAFGNVVHGFFELVTKRLQTGVLAETLLSEVAGWLPRIEAVLRAEGLPPPAIRREAPRVLAAIEAALKDREGQWLLGAREDAASEYAFTSWHERRSSFRLDRIFIAGTEPLAPGSDCLWIVDYKTASYGRGTDIDAFLAEERLKYAPQLESYARAIGADAEGKEMRVGLYYPMLPKLLWWKFEDL